MADYTAAGAAIGTAIMPGVGTAIGGIAGSLLSSPSAAQGGKAPGGNDASPQSSQAAAFGSGLDASGWIVQLGHDLTATLDNRQNKEITATGPTASASQSAGQPGGYGGYLDAGAGLGMGGGLGLDTVPPLVWMILIGAVAWKLSRKSKK
jgi:hypothetical protein